MTRPRSDYRPTPAGILTAAIGLALFWVAIRRAGMAEIAEFILRLGPGFAVVLLLSGVREVARSLAWMLCIEGDRPLRLVDALPARLTGEALGNLTPLGVFVSEPAKAVYVRDHVPLATGLPATVIENLLYSLSVVVVILLGTSALLLEFPIPDALRTVSIVSLSAMATMGGAALWLIGRRPKLATGVLEWLHGRGLFGRRLEPRIERVRALEERIYGFCRRHPRRLLPLVGLHAVFHLGGIAEVYTVLWFIIGPADTTLLGAFILETVNRVVTVVFKFVPLRLGVDEAATGLVSNVLGLGTTAGVTLALVRKARVLFWSTIGLAFLVRRGLSLRRVLDETTVAMGDGR